MTTLAPLAPRSVAAPPAPALAPHLVAVLREAFEGHALGEPRFTDPRPEGGLFGTLAMLSSAQVSRPAGGHGVTIAGHVQHLAFRLSAGTSWIRGEHRTWTWDESGQVRAVTDGEWLGLKAQLREEYGVLLATLERHPLNTDEALDGAIGALAHAVYHLGAIHARALARVG